jgi:hypothetical protein
MITVTITRTGGFAGISRQWTVQLDAEEWRSLLASGAPSASSGPDHSADRFVYRIRGGRRSLVIPDSRLDGRWRALVERARDERTDGTGESGGGRQVPPG